MIEFEMVLRLCQAELKKALKQELEQMGYAPVAKKGFLYANGDVPVLLVAHLDTVHAESPSIICYSKDGRYLMSPQGIGGDDRAGVCMILQIIRRVKCYVLFCEDEETGGRGARSFTTSGIRPDVNYIVELDRRGDNDAVYYGCDNRQFKKHIAEFGFQEQFGSFSDISVIAPHLDTAAVNISTGYYNAHRLHELIDRQVMEANVERVIEMVMTPTEHFAYRTGKSKTKGDLFLGTFRNDREAAGMGTKKLLMPLPENAVLLLYGTRLPCTQNYMIDSMGVVYAYIEALGMAVESEVLIACNPEGREHLFNYMDAQYVEVASYEEAMSRWGIYSCGCISTR